MRSNSFLSDVLNKPILLLFFICIGILSNVKVWDSDVLWHLQSGKVMYDTKSIIEKDVFSFTKSDTKWINDEWLGDVYLYKVYKSWNFRGVQFLSIIIVLLIILIIYSFTKSLNIPLTITLPIIFFAFIESRVRLLNHRPETFSYLFFFFILYILLRYHSIGSSYNKIPSFLFFIPIIQIFWVNIHPSSILTIFLLIAFIIAFHLSFLLSKYNTFKSHVSSFDVNIKGIYLILFLTIISSSLNPYGFHSITAPFSFVSQKMFVTSITEWAPLHFRDLLSISGYPGHIAFLFFILFGFLTFFFNFRFLRLFFTKRHCLQ